MGSSVTARIAALRRLTVAELREEWFRQYGEPARSRHRDFLWRRLTWRIQELQFGGLSDRARTRIDELAPGVLDLAARAKQSRTAADVAPTPIPTKRRRDPRLPAPGTILTRQYHDEEITVVTLDDGFEWDGQRFRSLSAVAKAVTGQKWNGRLFFGLTKRKR